MSSEKVFSASLEVISTVRKHTNHIGTAMRILSAARCGFEPEEPIATLDVQQVLAESGHRAGSSTRLRPKWRRAEDDEDQEAKRIDILEAENATLREQVEAWKAWQRRLIWKGPIGGGVLSELYDCIQTGPQPLGNQPTEGK